MDIRHPHRIGTGYGSLLVKVECIFPSVICFKENGLFLYLDSESYRGPGSVEHHPATLCGSRSLQSVRPNV